MGLLDRLRPPGIDQGVEEYRSTAGAVLLDVRSPAEYRGGHIPGSKNIPLQTLDKITDIVNDRDTPIFVHCQSGVRSARATGILKEMGYTTVKNIGGISAYHGKVET